MSFSPEVSPEVSQLGRPGQSPPPSPTLPIYQPFFYTYMQCIVHSITHRQHLSNCRRLPDIREQSKASLYEDHCFFPFPFPVCVNNPEAYRIADLHCVCRPALYYTSTYIQNSRSSFHFHLCPFLPHSWRIS